MRDVAEVVLLFFFIRFSYSTISKGKKVNKSGHNECLFKVKFKVKLVIGAWVCICVNYGVCWCKGVVNGGCACKLLPKLLFFCFSHSAVSKGLREDQPDDNACLFRFLLKFRGSSVL